MVERGGLENRCALAYPGFESLSLRHSKNRSLWPVFFNGETTAVNEASFGGSSGPGEVWSRRDAAERKRRQSLSQQELADKSIVSISALKRLESGSADPRMSTVQSIQQALEDAGIEFIPPANGKGEGVRLTTGS